MENYQTFGREARFSDLCEAVKHCNLCDRLQGRTKVLSKANGNFLSKVLFIAEAPGRLGADRTGIPLFGDKTGDNFEMLLGNISWRREEIFITNALLCNPRDEKGTNGTPTSEEIANCAPYLEMTVELVNPEVIVTLGSIALNALTYITPHNYGLKKTVGQILPWGGRALVPLYHPGPRARVHRSYAKQTSDFIALSKIVDPKNGIKSTKQKKLIQPKSSYSSKRSSEFQKLICAIVHSLGKMSYFKLTKLLYLIDLNALMQIGHTLTSEIYLRQQEGPWPPALKSAIAALKGQEVILSTRGRLPFIEPGPTQNIEIDFDDAKLHIVGDALERFGRMSNADIKTAVYRTTPMRYILKQERLGRDMRKVPVLYKNMTASEHDKAISKTMG